MRAAGASSGGAQAITEAPEHEEAGGVSAAWLGAYLTDQGLTQAAAAREAGISEAVVSGYLKGTYKGNSKNVEELFSAWVRSRERRLVSAQFCDVPEWVETPSAARVLGVLRYAQSLGDLAVIYGGAGLGKTCTLRHFAARGVNVWLATMRTSVRSVGAALEEIAVAVGLKDIPVRSGRLSRELIRRLEHTHGLLIVDEAQRMDLGTLEELRSLHDASGAGLVLCGNETVFAKVTGGSRPADFAQLHSRIGKRLYLPRGTQADAECLARAHGVAGKEEMAFLVDLSSRPGALRGMVKTLRLAAMLAAGAEAPLTVAHLREAWRDKGLSDLAGNSK